MLHSYKESSLYIQGLLNPIVWMKSQGTRAMYSATIPNCLGDSDDMKGLD